MYFTQLCCNYYGTSKKMWKLLDEIRTHALKEAQAIKVLSMVALKKR